MNVILDDITWQNCVKSTPIAAIDLIIVRDDSQILMGKRKNDPAKDLYFVPGGRIYKNESIKDAFERIIFEETKQNYQFSESKFQGCFEHFYNNSKWSSLDISTHYIVLAYRLDVDRSFNFDLTNQHKSLSWIGQDTNNNNLIHKYSRIYIDKFL